MRSEEWGAGSGEWGARSEERGVGSGERGVGEALARQQGSGSHSAVLAVLAVLAGENSLRSH